MTFYCCFVDGEVITAFEQTRMSAYLDKHHNKTDEALLPLSTIYRLYEVFCFTTVRPNPPICMTTQSDVIQQLPSDTT
jgi:hypothetical protein